MSERLVFLVPENTKSREVYNAREESISRANQEWFEYVSSVGANSLVHNGTHMLGVIFKTPVPDGWVKNKKDGCYRPHKRANPKEYKRFSDLPKILSGFQMSGGEYLGTDTPIISGMSIALPFFEKVGDRIYLRLVPEHKVPNDVVPVKLSEYYLFKESVESDAKPPGGTP